MKLQVGLSVKIEGDRENNIYVVRGFDPVANRYWLSVNEANYEGYNGDLIVTESYDGMVATMRDSRCSLPHKLVLTVF